MKKYKAIAIPVSFANDPPRFLTVRDRRFKDWIFVTGGSRRREIFAPLKTALRELEEETRGVVVLKQGEYTEFVFTVQDGDAELVYTVFVLFVDYDRSTQEDTIRRFTDEKMKTAIRKINKLPVKRTFDENDLMAWDTLEEFKARHKKWELIVENVLENPSFYTALNARREERKTFAVR
jgi:8-oxo-dGTP pyrophosphatase MutT (NUDIX family)